MDTCWSHPCCPHDALATSDPNRACCSWSWSVKTYFSQLFSKHLHNGLAKQHPLSMRSEGGGWSWPSLAPTLGCSCSSAVPQGSLAHAVSARPWAPVRLGWGVETGPETPLAGDGTAWWVWGLAAAWARSQPLPVTGSPIPVSHLASLSGGPLAQPSCLSVASCTEQPLAPRQDVAYKKVSGVCNEAVLSTPPLCRLPAASLGRDGKQHRWSLADHLFRGFSFL